MSWVWHVVLLFLDIRAKLFENPSKDYEDIDRTQNSEIWPLMSKCDLDLWVGDLGLAHDTSSYCATHLCQVIQKSIQGLQRYRPDTKNALMSNWPWPGDLGLVHETSSYCATHLCQVIWKYIQGLQRYRPDTKNALMSKCDLVLWAGDLGLAYDTLFYCATYLWRVIWKSILGLQDMDWTRKMLNMTFKVCVTLTFKQGVWVLRMTHRLTVLHICVKLFENPSKDYKDTDRTRKML